MRDGKLALDENFRILSEYLNKTTPKTGNRPGDTFVRWALQNNANVARVDCVVLAQHADRGFESFPADADLRDFDPPDRKFVAVACGHPDSPPILQAADSKWLAWDTALKGTGLWWISYVRTTFQDSRKEKAFSERLFSLSSDTASLLARLVRAT